LNADWQDRLTGKAGYSGGLKHKAGIWRLSDNAADLGRVLIRMAAAGTDDRQVLVRVGELFTEECFLQIQTAAPTSPAHPFDHGMNLILDALTWLRKNMCEQVSPDDLADRLGVSRRHLSRLFRVHTGRSIAEVLREERLQEAHRLLRETDWSVQQVAGMCGIDNASHFSTIFKTRFGQSPAQFRKR
jgi:transcriptional regulator GlxA family with amidase domain